MVNRGQFCDFAILSNSEMQAASSKSKNHVSLEIQTRENKVLARVFKVSGRKFEIGTMQFVRAAQEFD